MAEDEDDDDKHQILALTQAEFIYIKKEIRGLFIVQLDLPRYCTLFTSSRALMTIVDQYSLTR